jgi:CO/xanthine dehydrogenase Mo-binding subunit
VELSSVRVLGADTHRTADAGPTAASRQTYVSGNAVLQAATVIRQELLAIAAEMTGHPLDVLSLHSGWLYAEDERLSLTVANLATKASECNRRLHADGYYAMQYPEVSFHGVAGVAAPPTTFGTQGAQVLVDMETGQVTVERLVAVLNAGRIISHGGAYGQVEGGCAMGLGYALTEELLVDKGRTINTTLADYLVLTAADMPTIEARILEIPEPGGPLGVAGLGEPPVSGTAPAIVNAVSDALGVSLREIPLTAERVLAAIEAQLSTCDARSSTS